jgi:hypothetical protein
MRWKEIYEPVVFHLWQLMMSFHGQSMHEQKTNKSNFEWLRIPKGQCLEEYVDIEFEYKIDDEWHRSEIM